MLILKNRRLFRSLLQLGLIVVILSAGARVRCETENRTDGDALLKQVKPAGAKTANGMVTGTTGADAQKAGLDILKSGGSAADAAMATATAQIVLAAGSWVSCAGILSMVYYDADGQKVYNMNACYNTVKKETEPETIPQPDWSKGLSGVETAPNGRTVLVPGFVKGVEAASQRFGKLPMGKLFEPAIRLAEAGFEWNAGLARQFAFRQKVLTRDPETRAVFTKADGSFYKVGDTFRQPALANTLKKIVQHGADYIYTGPWAQKLVRKVRALGGKLTGEDLAAYEVIWEEPEHGAYHGYDIYLHGRPAMGGVNTIEALNLIEAAQLPKMGHYAQSPEALYWLTQIFKAANFINPATAGAPETRLTKAHAAKVWRAIQSGSPPCTPFGKQAPTHSDGVVAIDKWGNVACLVHSINTVSWGTTGLVIDGISIPDSAMIQVPVVIATTPGTRLPDPTNPGLVMKNAKPLMGFSSIGAGLHNRTVACLTNVLDYGMTPQEAINAPAFGFFRIKAEAGKLVLGDLTVGAKEFGPDLLETVAGMGQTIVEDATMLGYWIGIEIDPETGTLHGGMPRSMPLVSGGRVVGY